MSEKTKVTIVDDEACPGCTSSWGNANPELDFPNRPKVGDNDGAWWWKCYNPNCKVDYYEPESGRFDLALSPERAKELYQEVINYVDSLDIGAIDVIEILPDDVEVIDKRKGGKDAPPVTH
jgi:hypothetical protein